MQIQGDLATNKMLEVKNLKLSICIATYNRGAFIGETLDSILLQMPLRVELVVVDGASPDNTPEVMAQYLLRHPEIRYFREQENSGIDRDYDKAVGYARGEYCWLMTDDDLLRAGSVSRVLDSLGADPDLVVVNAEVKNADFSAVLNERMLKFPGDREYAGEDGEKFFSEMAGYLSFVGGVVIKRQLWLDRDRASYYGTLFVHVGVIFQRPSMNRIMIISDPLIIIRYGNAMWTSRGFEIWLFKWPKLIWSFDGVSDEAKKNVCNSAPWKGMKTLFYYRASGAYSIEEFHKFIDKNVGGIGRLIALGISIFPGMLANIIAVAYWGIFKRSDRMGRFDLLRSRHAVGFIRWFDNGRHRWLNFVGLGK